MIKPLWPYPAALINVERKRTLVIADLHIGWEMSLSDKGIHIPSQMPRLLSKLSTLVSKYKPDRLLVLGDVKYSISIADIGEWHDVPDFFMTIRKQIPETWIIRGNHDGDLDALLPEKIEILPSTGIVYGDVGFFHGHQWPSLKLLRCRTLVMGHVHPVVVFRDLAGFRMSRQVWVRTKCDTKQLTKMLLQKAEVKIEKSPEATLRRNYKIKPKSEQLLIMPSFNEFLGGRPLNMGRSGMGSQPETIVGPVLRSQAVDMNDAELYLLDGTYLGTLAQLKEST